MNSDLSLFIDTETDGLVKKDLPDEHPDQPHLVQLGLILADSSGAEWATVELIVKPNGYRIPDGAAKVHGISTEMALAVGVPLLVAVATFTNLRSIANRVVAHNLAFDDKVMRAAIARTGKKPAHPGPSEQVCTMELASAIMKLPPTAKMKAAGFLKHKPPNLTETHQYFLGEGFTGAHGALADVRACSRVFWEIQKRQGVGAKNEMDSEVPF